MYGLLWLNTNDNDKIGSFQHTFSEPIAAVFETISNKTDFESICRTWKIIEGEDIFKWLIENFFEYLHWEVFFL